MIFFGLMSGLAAVLNGYLWRRLVRDTRLPPWAARSATLVLLVLAATVPATLLSWRFISRSATPALTSIAFGWLGVSFYSVALLLVWDVYRVCRVLVRRRWRVAPSAPQAVEHPPQPLAAEAESRRVFLARSVAASALLTSGGIGVFGVRSAVWDITTPELSVALSRLPRQLDGFSIALLTDVHIGPMLDGRFLRQLVDQTLRLKPDMIAIGGDLVDGHVRHIGSMVAELRRLTAPYGVYFVTGNHEYYSGARHWIAFLQQLGVNVLLNEHVAVGDAARGGASFDLAGVTDFRAAKLGGVAPDAKRATEGRDPSRELIMLAHQPIQIAASAEVGAGLQLSGHTHGGQLYPFGSVTRFVQPYLAGLHRHVPAEPASVNSVSAGISPQIYVSRGTGFWGPPMRVLAPAEIALLRLYAG
ncbi:MAG: metallophosphoesterase [Polyangiales bacterium]